MGFSVFRRGIGFCRSAGGGFFINRSYCSEKAAASMSGNLSPLLMLPPISLSGDEAAFKFHSLGRKGKEATITCEKSTLPGEEEEKEKVYYAGSSHGWLFVHNWMSRDFLMLDPFSGRQIKLPPIRTQGLVSRVALDDEGCRAMVVFGGQQRRLALCVPGRSNEWTPLGGERKYDDVAYSTAHQLFFCVTKNGEYLSEVEGWNVKEPLSPRIESRTDDDWQLLFDYHKYPWPSRSPSDADLKQFCWRIKYVVPHGLDLYVLVRHVNPRKRDYGYGYVYDYDYDNDDDIDDEQGKYVAPPIYVSKYRGWASYHPYVTFDFDVYKIDRTGRVRFMKCSLEGLAMFVGNNHSFAVEVEEGDPELKPDCIYFSDENSLMRRSRSFVENLFGGHDNGIFDYRNNKFVSCCDGCPLNPVSYDGIKRIEPAPMWFTPPTLTHPGKVENLSQ